MSSKTVGWCPANATLVTGVEAKLDVESLKLTVRGHHFDHVTAVQVFNNYEAAELERPETKEERDSGAGIDRTICLLLPTMRAVPTYHPYKSLASIAEVIPKQTFDLWENRSVEIFRAADHSKDVVGGRRNQLLTCFLKEWFRMFSADVQVYPISRLLEEWTRSLRKGWRVIFITKHGFIGIATNKIQQDDIVVLLQGYQYPAILRPLHNGTYSFHGFAYVNGIMEGELESEAPEVQFEAKDFVLV